MSDTHHTCYRKLQTGMSLPSYTSNTQVQAYFASKLSLPFPRSVSLGIFG